MDFAGFMSWAAITLVGAGGILTNFAMWRMSKFANVKWSARDFRASDSVLRAYARKHGKPGLEKLLISGYLLAGLGVVAFALSRH